MTRPIRLALVAVASALVLSSCGEGSGSDWVATVDGEDIDRAELESFAEGLGQQDLLTSGDETRAMITEMIHQQFAADPSAAQAAYEDWPDGSPVSCLGVILVEDEAGAAAVKQAVSEGTPLAEIVDELAAEGQDQLAPGGIASQDGTECFSQPVKAELQTALVEADFGEGVDFTTALGPTVVFLRSWDDLSEATRQRIAEAMVDSEELSAASISVNSRFGQWDAVAGAVVASV